MLECWDAGILEFREWMIPFGKDDCPDEMRYPVIDINFMG